eukprot:snap_masked-scaffold1384_size43947-processed-gene-0.3 protein:Tk01942 transcript:snap_masked-scaffold1384_size43947-processed-gene-0.3-mRNA-1 annotation:"pyrroline-5-carboxylate reductase family protein"
MRRRLKLCILIDDKRPRRCAVPTSPSRILMGSRCNHPSLRSPFIVRMRLAVCHVSHPDHHSTVVDGGRDEPRKSCSHCDTIKRTWLQFPRAHLQPRRTSPALTSLHATVAAKIVKILIEIMDYNGAGGDVGGVGDHGDSQLVVPPASWLCRLERVSPTRPLTVTLVGPGDQQPSRSISYRVVVIVDVPLVLLAPNTPCAVARGLQTLLHQPKQPQGWSGSGLEPRQCPPHQPSASSPGWNGRTQAPGLDLSLSRPVPSACFPNLCVHPELSSYVNNYGTWIHFLDVVVGSGADDSLPLQQ